MALVELLLLYLLLPVCVCLSACEGWHLSNIWTSEKKLALPVPLGSG